MLAVAPIAYKSCKKISSPAIFFFCRKIGLNQEAELTISTDGCRGTPEEVLYLEHVQAKITLSASKRGAIEVFLTSPAGTKSTLLARRTRDTSTEGFSEWPFMTTHNWGELSSGTWTLHIKNGGSSCKYPCKY